MEIERKEVDGVWVIIPQDNRIDAASAADFKGQIVDLLNQGVNRLVLNLTQVSFIDSSGLTAIISSLKTLSLGGGKMTICGLNKNVANLFKITKLDRIVNLFNVEAEAVAELKSLS